MRDTTGAHAVFDVGVHGYMNAGHAHADALSLTLSLDGKPFLIDPGTATYTMDPEVRNRFRSTPSHNAVTIDDRPQAIPRGPFHWHTRADAAVHGWRSHASFDWAEASHHGYAPLTHRRTVVRARQCGWLVVDEMLGTGSHVATSHWHFDPRWNLRACGEAAIQALHLDGGQAWLVFDAGVLSLVHGDEASGRGWMAPAYGALVPTWNARIRQQGELPMTLATWVGVTPRSVERPVCLERLTPEAGAVRPVVLRLTTGTRTSTFVLHPGSAMTPKERASSVAGYQSDARVFHCTVDAGFVSYLDVIDATHVVTPEGGGLTIEASEPLAHLHVEIADGVLHLEASQPPPHLRLHGGAINRLVAISLNHREQPLAAMRRSDAVFVNGSDWAGRVRDLLPSIA
jgi:hypothetical protein